MGGGLVFNSQNHTAHENGRAHTDRGGVPSEPVPGPSPLSHTQFSSSTKWSHYPSATPLSAPGPPATPGLAAQGCAATRVLNRVHVNAYLYRVSVEVREGVCRLKQAPAARLTYSNQ